jgi:hypothetical protein
MQPLPGFRKTDCISHDANIRIEDKCPLEGRHQAIMRAAVVIEMEKRFPEQPWPPATEYPSYNTR